MGPNLDPDGNKIEDNFTGPLDIDVSYVDGYSVPTMSSSDGIQVLCSPSSVSFSVSTLWRSILSGAALE